MHVHSPTYHADGPLALHFALFLSINLVLHSKRKELNEKVTKKVNPPHKHTPTPSPNPMASYAAEQLKDKGNLAFRNGSYAEAEDFYTQAIQKYSRNPLIFTNRANARLKLQQWDGAVNDCLKSLEITTAAGGGGHNHKANYFLAQAQLALHHPHEALSSALTAYEQVRDPKPNAKIGPRDLEVFSAFVLKCKKAKFAVRDRERLRRQGDLRAELEGLLEERRQREVEAVAGLLERGEIGQVEASVWISFLSLSSLFSTIAFFPRSISDHPPQSLSFHLYPSDTPTRDLWRGKGRGEKGFFSYLLFLTIIEQLKKGGEEKSHITPY